MESPSKPLSEVIKAVETCEGYGSCTRCPYYQKDGKYLCYENYGNHMLKDCLYYLKTAQRRMLGVE